jgi:MFS family permease
LTTYLRQARRSIGSVFANPSLGRVQLAFVAFNAGEWGVWIAMLVYAYERGGATTAGFVALAQLVPAAIFAPVAATLGDRHRPGRVLASGYLVQSVALAATAATLLLDGPPLLAYGLAAVAATAVTITRPAQAALLPALARTPDELTATNVVSGWTESISMLAAPALAGVLLGWHGPGAVFAVMAALLLAACVLVSSVPGPEPVAHPGEEGGAFRLLVREPGARLLVAVLGAQYIVIGALDVLFVVLAVSVLELGGSGAGYLNAAFGAGGVMGIAVTVALVGRSRLVPPLVLGVVAGRARSCCSLYVRPRGLPCCSWLLRVRGERYSMWRDARFCSVSRLPSCSRASSARSRGSRWRRLPWAPCSRRSSCTSLAHAARSSAPP